MEIAGDINVSKRRDVMSLAKGCRVDFPILMKSNVCYLDSASSSQKPQSVIDTVEEFYVSSYANVHRGVYELGEKATFLFEGAREKVRQFIGADSGKEIIFTRGTTESINLIAYSLGSKILDSESEVLITQLEHHANFVPWQQLGLLRGAKVNYAGLTEAGEFDFEDFCSKLNKRTKIVAASHLPNALGVLLPIQKIIEHAHAVGALVLIDAAQSIAHMPLDVSQLDVDFLVFSGHKLYGPTGVGVLYGKQELLDSIPPFMFGGEMIRQVRMEETTFNDLPYKFEAGTPNIAGAIGLSAAIDYVNNLGLDNIEKHCAELISALETELCTSKKLELLGPAGKHTGLVCFSVDGIHPHDIAQFMDKEGIAVRAGHHCAQPLHRHFGISASTRVSFGAYNTLSDVKAFSQALQKTISFFGG